MNVVKDSNYYREQAERCHRWIRSMNDKRSIADLEKIADEYMAMAERLRAIEGALQAKTEPALT